MTRHSIKISEHAYRVAARIRASRIEDDPSCSLADIASEALVNLGRKSGLDISLPRSGAPNGAGTPRRPPRSRRQRAASSTE